MFITTVKYAIKVLPESAVYRVARGLAAMTQRPPVTSVEQDALSQALRLQ